MRRVEQMQDFKNAKPDQKIRRKNSCNIYSTYLEDFSSRHLHPKKKRDSNEKNGKRTRMYAVKNSGQQNKWQKPCTPIAQVPYKRGGYRTVFENYKSDDDDDYN